VPEPTCRYCGSVIVTAGRRGRNAKLHITCGAAECQKKHQRVLAAAWRDANREKFRAQSKAWKLANPERKQATMRAWWDANRERQYEINKAWRDANPERNRNMIEGWHRRNPTKMAEYRARRVAWEQSGYISERDWRRLCRRYGDRCAYCRAALPLTMDHVVPLVRGGQHAIGNILPACLPCNCSKQDRLLVEWRAGKPARRRKRIIV
jgi:5-methylcytosine-specific restriction endonuclease McrA